MSKLEDINYLHQLYDYYGSLLTEKQRDNFELYYFEDLSLAEIAEELKISRNAVHNNLQATINNLKNYENHLGMVAKKAKLVEIVIKIEDTKTVNDNDISELKKML